MLQQLVRQVGGPVRRVRERLGGRVLDPFDPLGCEENGSVKYVQPYTYSSVAVISKNSTLHLGWGWGGCNEMEILLELGLGLCFSLCLSLNFKKQRCIHFR